MSNVTGGWAYVPGYLLHHVGFCHYLDDTPGWWERAEPVPAEVVAALVRSTYAPDERVQVCEVCWNRRARWDAYHAGLSLVVSA